MQIDRNKKILQATSRESGRYATQHVLFDGRHLVATDGSILAVVAVDSLDEGDEPGLLPRDAVTCAFAGHAPRNRPARILSNGDVSVPTAPGSPSFERPQGEFPRWQAVVPDRGKLTLTLGLDARRLARLAQALGATQVRLSVDPEHLAGPVLVEAGPHAWGLIMPVAVDVSPVREA
jgi:hypothetical protein